MFWEKKKIILMELKNNLLVRIRKLNFSLQKYWSFSADLI